MIILKKMEWDNCFSFANGNIIEFDKNPVTQLTGTNGVGKTSISMLIQEVLYGKNSKNIKKTEIENNKTGVKGYNIKLWFDKNQDEYLVDLQRKSSLKLKFYKNGEDISSHTSLNTYKTITEVIGIDDFKVFCQLIYQHSTDSLDFLTATDTNRKKFLISLLQLDRYIELHEHFKQRAKETANEVSAVSGSIDTINSWIRKHSTVDLTERLPVEVPKVDEALIIRKDKIRKDLDNLNQINRKIVQNNEYKKTLAEIDSKYYLNAPPPSPQYDIMELRLKLGYHLEEKKRHNSELNKLKNLNDECPTCLQPIDEAWNIGYIKALNTKIQEEEIHISKYHKLIQETDDLERLIEKYKKAAKDFESLNRLIDSSLPGQTLDKFELMSELNEIEKTLVYETSRKEIAEKENIKIHKHNSTIRVIKEQLVDMRKELAEKQIQLENLRELEDILELLKKTFGTNGLVSYKIESSVKELEKEINNYLSEMSEFQIYFKLSGEKLNIEVLDDVGNITSIPNLSSGEQARVNIATILAIRKIMSSLTSTKLNLLFLDEVVSVIDSEGKEKLTEILLKENLNTFMVSHDWSHPLIPKLNIVKEHNISRIEDDG